MKPLKELKSIIRGIFKYRDLLLQFSIRDFQASYRGSSLGITWVFVEPIVYMGVMWLFFTQAFNASAPQKVPYIPWLMCTMICWFFTSGTLGALCNVFTDYKYILQKPEINMGSLLIVRILQMFYIHLIFLGLLIAILLASGSSPSIYWLQSIYYIFCLFYFLFGAGLLISSIFPFFKDVKNLVSVMLQLGFWMSPIFWEIDRFPQPFHIFLKLNPLYYPLIGYRNSFLFETPFWSDLHLMGYFWFFATAQIGIGSYVYSKLRPGLGDVL